MEDHEQQDNSPQRAGSEEALVSPRPPRGGSNSRAFKVAALTVLACLLLASQALTAYLVISQRSQIHSLQKNADKMSKRITARPQGPVQMHVPMNSMPLLKDFTEEDTKTQTPMTKLLPAEVMSVEKQVKVFLQNVSLPEFNQTFQRNLQSLQAQMDSEGWMSFETWMRNWLIFQMAQQTPTVPAKALQSKCFLQAKAVHPGFYKPQCDEQGHFKPMQCWHSTGFCWCVDAEGNPIPGSSMRGRPTCDGAPKPAPGMRRMLKTMQLESDK